MNTISILDMPEDLLVEDRSDDVDKNQISVNKSYRSKKFRPTPCSSSKDLVGTVAKILKIPVKELQDWIDEAVIPKGVLKTILMTAKRLKLNPILGHIAWECNQEGGYEVFIPIDGWITMIHREPSFQGLSFNQSGEVENGIPIWIECTIYRSDLTRPLTVREYYVEVRGDHPIWQEMPRRMLRHKTLQQCARLAFGITIPELITKPIGLEISNRKTPMMRYATLKRKDLLRNKILSEPR